MAVLIICILAISQNNGSKAEKILYDDYYDWSYPSAYSFVIEGAAWTAGDIRDLPEEAYSDLKTQDPQIIRLLWDTETKTVTECQTKDGDAMRYYLFHTNRNAMVLIPAERRFRLFEESRPLAFYLVRN